MVEPGTLERAPLLKGLNDAARRELSARAVLCRFAPGEVLWRAGTAPRGLFLVVEGEVRVTRASSGRSHVVHTEGIGGTLGDFVLFGGGPYPATAAAAQRTVCIALDRDAIHAAIRADPELAFRLLARLAARGRHLVERLDRLATRPVSARLAEHLLTRHASVKGAAFTLGGTQTQVAEELGTVREVVVRTLRELRQRQLIDAVGKGRYIVQDEAALRRLAAGPQT